MGAELGGVEGRMRGTVISGAAIEQVLASVPEQVWDYDDEWLVGDEARGYTPMPIATTIPMAKRREIVATVLGVVEAG